MENIFSKVIDLNKADDYDGILKEIKKIEGHHQLPPQILVLRGTCILLSDDDQTYSLEDAENSFKDALAIDPDYIDAYIELGHFHLNVMDDAEKALPCFKNALGLARSQTSEAVTGYAFCIGELESSDKAIDFLNKNSQNSMSKEQIDKITNDIRIIYNHD